MQLLKSDIEKNLEEIRMLAEAGIALCRQEDGPYLYEEALSQDLKTVELLLKADSFEAQQEVFPSFLCKIIGEKNAGSIGK